MLYVRHTKSSVLEVVRQANVIANVIARLLARSGLSGPPRRRDAASAAVDAADVEPLLASEVSRGPAPSDLIATNSERRALGPTVMLVGRRTPQELIHEGTLYH